MSKNLRYIGFKIAAVHPDSSQPSGAKVKWEQLYTPEAYRGMQVREATNFDGKKIHIAMHALVGYEHTYTSVSYKPESFFPAEDVFLRRMHSLFLGVVEPGSFMQELGSSLSFYRLEFPTYDDAGTKHVIDWMFELIDPQALPTGRGVGASNAD